MKLVPITFILLLTVFSCNAQGRLWEGKMMQLTQTELEAMLVKAEKSKKHGKIGCFVGSGIAAIGLVYAVTEDGYNKGGYMVIGGAILVFNGLLTYINANYQIKRINEIIVSQVSDLSLVITPTYFYCQNNQNYCQGVSIRLRF